MIAILLAAVLFTPPLHTGILCVNYDEIGHTTEVPFFRGQPLLWMEGMHVSGLTKDVPTLVAPWNHCDVNVDGNASYGLFCVNYRFTGMTTAIPIALPGVYYGTTMERLVWTGPTANIERWRGPGWDHCIYSFDGG